MFNKILLERQEKDINQFIFRNTHYLKNDVNNIISLEDVYQSSIISKKAFLQNKMNTLFNFSEDKDIVFFTLTQPSFKHKQFKNLSENEKIEDIKNQAEVFQKFLRSLLKTRSMKIENSGARYYVRSREFHKSFMLHEHIAAFTQNALLWTYSLYNLYNTNRKSLGRLEIVLDFKFKDSLLSNFREIVLDGENVLVSLNITKKELNSGNFFYIKFLKNNDDSQKVQMLKYVMKYVLKSQYGKKDLSKREKIERALFLKCNIRSVMFSSFLFPSYLYHKLQNSLTGEYIYNKFSLRELTKLKNNGYFKKYNKFDKNLSSPQFLNEFDLNFLDALNFDIFEDNDDYITYNLIKSLDYVVILGIVYRIIPKNYKLFEISFAN